jgi:transcriptional regulator with XRE-family HTH domain
MTHTIGQRLKAEREEQRLTFENVFEATRIRIQYLQALEADDLSIMPSPVQARGYLRNYAEYLGFDVDLMLDEMRTLTIQPPPGEVIGPADEHLPAPRQEPPSPEHSAAASAPALSNPPEESSARVEETAPPPMSVTVPTKPKPARRKKTELVSEAVEASPTKRRGRKKSEPEAVPVMEQVSPPQESAEESIATVRSDPGPAPEEHPEVLPDTAPPVDAGDRLWQSWLNRLGSTVSARMRRRTLIAKQTRVPEP